MNEKHITSDNFDRGIRETLRYQHGFEHADLERAKGIIGDAIAHVEHKADTRLGLSGKHLDMAMKFLHEDHEGWRGLPEHQQRHIEAALKDHFDIKEPVAAPEPELVPEATNDSEYQSEHRKAA